MKGRRGGRREQFEDGGGSSAATSLELEEDALARLSLKGTLRCLAISTSCHCVMATQPP